MSWFSPPCSYSSAVACGRGRGAGEQGGEGEDKEDEQEEEDEEDRELTRTPKTKNLLEGEIETCPRVARGYHYRETCQ